MPVIDELAALLVTQNVGVLGTSIFKASTGKIPAGDGPFLSLTETGGTGSLRTHNGTPVARPSVQILTRGRLYNITRAMAAAAFNAFGGDKGIHNVLLSSIFYQSVIPAQQPTDIGLDADSRVMISFNLEIEKQPS